MIDGRLNGTGGVGIPTPESTSRFGRFKSSTPLHFVPSTSSYMATPSAGPTSRVQTPTARIQTSTPNVPLNSGAAASPLRRAIAQNEKAFGSLGRFEWFLLFVSTVNDGIMNVRNPNYAEIQMPACLEFGQFYSYVFKTNTTSWDWFISYSPVRIWLFCVRNLDNCLNTERLASQCNLSVPIPN